MQNFTPKFCELGDSLSVTITGQNTTFTQDTSRTAYLFQGSNTLIIYAHNTQAVNDTTLIADFYVPSYASCFDYSMNLLTSQLPPMAAAMTTPDKFVVNCPANVIYGNVFADYNQNCVQDTGESPLVNYMVEADNGTESFYGSTNSNGQYAIRINTSGTFKLTPDTDSYTCAGVHLCNNPGDTVIFSSIGDTIYNKNYGVLSNGVNLDLHLRWSAANPGFNKEYEIRYRNAAGGILNDTITVIFSYDSALIYQGSTTMPIHDTINHRLIWKIPSVLNAFTGWTLVAKIQFLVPASTPINYVANSTFIIEPVIGDCNPANNTDTISQIVTGSFDPNEKQVLPKGDILETDSVLTYTIHFQNTGNDTTHFINLYDELPPELNPLMVENIASSHNFTEFNVSGNGILHWKFDPIYLPDSSTNEQESQGFVMFKVKKKTGLPVGTEIRNNAVIYFDFNPPIITNAVVSKIVDASGITLRPSPLQNVVNVYPNPSRNYLVLEYSNWKQGANYDFEIMDLSGKTIRKYDDMGQIRSIIHYDLPPGLYIYRLKTNPTQTGKIVIVQ